MERTKYTPKRLLSLLLALIMLLGMLPTAVFAAGETAKQSNTTSIVWNGVQFDVTVECATPVDVSSVSAFPVKVPVTVSWSLTAISRRPALTSV